MHGFSPEFDVQYVFAISTILLTCWLPNNGRQDQLPKDIRPQSKSLSLSIPTAPYFW